MSVQMANERLICDMSSAGREISDSSSRAETLSFLTGGGEMGERIRAFDWAGTELGPPDRWPAPLRTAVRILLTTNHPLFIFWGPNHICLYNDAYSRSLGPKNTHPCLATRGRACGTRSGRSSARRSSRSWRVAAPRGTKTNWCRSSATAGSSKCTGRTATARSTTSTHRTALAACWSSAPKPRRRYWQEQQLRSAEQRWRNLFDQAPGFVCVLRGSRTFSSTRTNATWN